MPTNKQKLGLFGETVVSKNCYCPKCKKHKTLKLLPPNFKCADLICDFCGFLAQIKAISVNNIDTVPKSILGAAWPPQKQRMEAGIYFPLFVVLFKSTKEYSIFYLSADLQIPGMFVARKPLSETARRAGWQGFMIDLSKLPENVLVRIK